jgi:transitional endoplasmic reticulum ATPase
MTKVVRSNLRLRLGDTVDVSAFPNVKFAKSVQCLPFADTIEGITGDMFEVFLNPYFHEKYRPLKIGDTFTARGGMRAVEFKVTSIEGPDGGDEDYCIVGKDTEILCDGDGLGREEDGRLSEVGYDDIGGCNKQLAQIRLVLGLELGLGLELELRLGLELKLQVFLTVAITVILTLTLTLIFQ